MRPPRVPPRWTLPALLALAALVRLFAWSRALMMMNDGPDFLWQAERLLAGDVAAALAHPYHPLYGALAAAFALLTGDVLSGALCVSIGSGVALTGTAWWVARRLFPSDAWAPAATALVAAVTARAVQYGADVQSDGLAAALWFAALAALLAALLAAWQARRGARALLLAGAFTGLGYLTRPELLAAALPALWVVLARRGLAARARAAAAFAAPLLVLALPYVFAMHAETGTWGLSLKPSLQLSGLSSAPFVHQAPPDSPLGSPVAWRDKTRAPERPPTGEARRAAEAEPEQRDASILALPDRGEPLADAALAALGDFVHAARGEFLVLVLAGLITLWKRGAPIVAASAVAWSTWMAVTAAQLALVGYATNRHLLPAILALLPLAGAGLARLARGGWPARVLLALVLYESLRAGTDEQRADHAGRLQALAWVAEHTPEGARFATHRRRDGWYAQRPVLTLDMPVNDADLRRLLTQHDVHTLVLDERRVLEHHPDWLADGQVEELARFGAGEDTALVLRARFGE